MTVAEEIQWGRTDYGNTWHRPRDGRARCRRDYRLTSPLLTTAQADRQPMTFFCANCRKGVGI